MSRRDLWDQVDGDLYQLLGVESSASADEIQVAWRSTAKRLHPDRGGSVTEFQQAEIATRSSAIHLNVAATTARVGSPSPTPRRIPAPASMRTRIRTLLVASHRGRQMRPTSILTVRTLTETHDPTQHANHGIRGLVALAILLGILAVVAAVMLALVTFLVLFAGCHSPGGPWAHWTR